MIKRFLKKYKVFVILVFLGLIYSMFKNKDEIMETIGNLISPFKSKFKVTSPFGDRIHPVTKKAQFHNGVDFGTPLNTPVYASFDGTVSTFQDAQNGNALILYSDTLKKRIGFAHLNKYQVKQGRVKKGDLIAFTGSTGRSTGPHVHVTLKDTVSNQWMDITKVISI